MDTFTWVNFSYITDKLRDLELFSTGKRNLWGDLIAAFLYMKGTDKKAVEGLFTKACSNRIGGEMALNWKKVDLY